MKFNDEIVVQAVRESLEETIAQFGIEYVRTLSWFPSARECEHQEAA